MAVPIPGVEVSAQLLKLEITMKGGVLLFISDVSLTNNTKLGAGQSAVVRFSDIPPETSAKLVSLIAEIELNAGTRFLAGII